MLTVPLVDLRRTKLIQLKVVFMLFFGDHVRLRSGFMPKPVELGHKWNWKQLNVSLNLKASNNKEGGGNSKDSTSKGGTKPQISKVKTLEGDVMYFCCSAAWPPSWWWLMFDVTSQQNVAKYLFLFLPEPDNSVQIVDIRMILFSHCHHTYATEAFSGVVSPKEVFMNAEAAIPQRRSVRIHQ